MTFLSCREKSPLDSQASYLAVDVRALIVTAHPDDECMFFAPIILGLVEMKIPVHILCLSKGKSSMNIFFLLPESKFIKMS